MSKLIAPRIVFVGKTNSGKSTLVNLIAGQEVSIVSQIAGTTTDPVRKRTELLGFGPIDLIDTAGFEDQSELGQERVAKTLREIDNADILIYCDETGEFLNEKLIDERTICVTTKAQISKDDILGKILNKLGTQKEPTLLEGLLKKGDKVLHVTPIDSEAPKGRLILPQVQMIRECLDKGIISTVIQPEQMECIDTSAFNLVICDSQVFKEVEMKLPKQIPLTSYSILFARQKGDINYFFESAKQIDKLTKNSKVLVFESCSHNVSHEDIGTVKIPNMIKKYLGFLPNLEHRMSLDFPTDISKYDLIIHCGSCMLGSQAMKTRITKAKASNVAMTNYGIAIAYMQNIATRAMEIFE